MPNGTDEQASASAGLVQRGWQQLRRIQVGPRTSQVTNDLLDERIDEVKAILRRTRARISGRVSGDMVILAALRRCPPEWLAEEAVKISNEVFLVDADREAPRSERPS